MTGRRYRLEPWLIRAIIPSRRIGSYLLFDHATPIYVGRSDTCLRRRLLQHARAGRGCYFTFDVHPHALGAFATESAVFHVLGAQLRNQFHPDAPNGSGARCPFCNTTWARAHIAHSLNHLTALPSSPGRNS